MNFSQSNYANLIPFFRFAWIVWRSANREWKYKLLQVNRIVKSKGLTVESSYTTRLRLYAFVNEILMNWVSTLRGTSWSHNERKACQSLTTLIPFYDDQFDHREQYFSWQSLLENQKEDDPGPIIICKFLLAEIIVQIPNRDDFFHILDRIHAAQRSSLDQLGTKMNRQDLEQITWEKGGSSMLLFRGLWKHPPRPGEQEAWFCLGGLLQLCNDIFDIYRDLQAGISTLATIRRDVRELRQYFTAQIGHMTRAFMELDYPPANKRGLLRKVMFVCGRVFVCLDQLARAQADHGGRLDVEKLDRAHLVCDMERPGNFWNGIRYSLIDLDLQMG